MFSDVSGFTTFLCPAPYTFSKPDKTGLGTPAIAAAWHPVAHRNRGDRHESIDLATAPVRAWTGQSRAVSRVRRRVRKDLRRPSWPGSLLQSLR